MKVAYVTVRYGASILGGAEQACRQLAEHLAADQVDVSVFTTCATDSVTWADALPAGTTAEGGVTVHRFASVAGRDSGFEDLSASVLSDPAHQPAPSQQRWLNAQGPVCPAAVEAAVASDADLLICTPYLYWPTVELLRTAPTPVVLHPAAHDEAPIRLPLFATAFAAAAGLAFYTDGERRLVERLWPPLASTPQLVVGLGVSTDAGHPPAGGASGADPGPSRTFATEHGLDGRPYLLCLGRVDDGKGVAVLSRFFAAYKRRRRSPLALVFVGPVVHPPPPHPDVVVTGPLPEDAKWAALRSCEALVTPSANESFSIVLLEAWAAGRPALVNARCAATAEHVRRSRAGVTFGSYAAFETALDRILGDPSLAASMGAAGREYVEKSFAWPVVTRRYRRWLEHLASAPVH